MKKTKFLTKVLAVVFALALLVALAVPAMAASNTYNGSNQPESSVTNNSIPLTKGIVMFNPEGSTVRVPAIKFAYTVAPVTDPTALGIITDDQNKTVTVNAGVANGVGGAELVFNPATDTAETVTDTGTEVERRGNLAVNFGTAQTPTFTHAGVFRYLITESIKDLSGNDIAVADLPKYGFEARTNEYSVQRYLDVYIENDDTAATGLSLQAAVIFKTDAVDKTPASQNGPLLGKDAITTTTEKTTGFEPAVDPTDPSQGGGTVTDYTNDETVDRYFTYDLKVKKTTTGNLADKNHDFPFVVTLQNAATFVPTVTADVVNSGATDVSGTTVAISSSTATVSAKMSDGDYITIKGLPKGTTATVQETNDTKDEYTAAWDTVDGTTSTSLTPTRYNASNVAQTGLAMAENDYVKTTGLAVDGGQTVANDGTIGGDYKLTTVGYTNTISDISPTGLAFRIAPYVLMLTAGISLILLFAKRRREVTDMI